jgi:YD repeat-containing protein
MLIGERRLGYEKQVSVGDKYTDSYAITSGLLKKITFPTQGYTEFTYQANVLTESSELIRGGYGKASLLLMNFPENRRQTKYFKTMETYEDSRVKVQMRLNYFADPNIEGDFAIDREGFYGYLRKESPRGSGNYESGGIYLTTEKVNQDVTKYYDLEPNTRYKLEGFFTAGRSDREALIGVEYKASNDTIINNQSIALNGVSISSISSYAANQELAWAKQYTYTKKDSNKSSGSNYFNKFQYVTSDLEQVLCTMPNSPYVVPLFTTSTTVHSNSLLPMNDAIGDGRVAYSRVVEKILYGTGASSTTEYLYQVLNASTGFSCITNNFSGPPKWVKADWGHGSLLEKNAYNEKEEKVHQEIYTYEEDQSKRKEVRGLSTHLRYVATAGHANNGTNINPLNIEHIGYTMYSVNSFRSYLKSITTIDYTGNKQMQEKKTFDYSSSKHYQKTKMEVANETTTITEQYVYPDDILSSTSLTGEPLTTGEYQEINRLKKTATHQPAALIQTSTYKDGTLNGISRNLYKNWNNTPLYHKTISSKGTGNFNPADFQVTHYNRNSKVEETEDQSGSKTVYLYGYGQTLLLARIQNATKEQVASALGVSIANLITIDETKLTQLNNLRTNTALKDALITTYEHKPLVGITKMTDPKGSSISYEYDSFNRLKAIKDSKGNIIEEYEYNYKNNQ